MRMRRLTIENFRRIASADFLLEPAAFLVGPNNAGKSSVITALEALLSLDSEKLVQADILENPDGTRADSTVITGYICDIPADVAASRGFRGRVVDGEFVYRKTLSATATKPVLETREYPFELKPQFVKCRTVGDLLQAGLTEEVVQDGLGFTDPEKPLPKKGWERLVPDALVFDTTAQPTWVENPGGIPQNVLSRLPRLIRVPAIADHSEIVSGEKAALGECLALLFEDLIAGNPVAASIQQNLGALEEQMNPDDQKSLVAGLLREVNEIIGEVFPDCGISIVPSLQDLLKVLRPKYAITLFSNIKTDASRQGTGLVRTAIFAMLRHRARMKIEKALQTRPIIVAFEEPELYLHPSAANMLRDTIYQLGRSDQIVCSTHSPWMIDLSRDLQSLTRVCVEEDGSISAHNYGVSAKLGALGTDDRERVKMLQVFDDELSRVFFADSVVIVEGDSEVLAIRGTLPLLPPNTRKLVHSRFQVVKARGKASIISLVRYLNLLGLTPRVMHDGDFGVPGAEAFNQPIADALGDTGHLVVLDRNLEDTLGYTAPSNDRPFRAFQHVRGWTSISDVPESWKTAMAKLFDVAYDEASPQLGA